MKLYLSSSKIGNQEQELKKWLENSKNKKAAFIANARDMSPEGEHKTTSIQKDADELAALGFEIIPLDLRNYFGKKEELRSFLQEIHAFYVIGGNTFVLRKAMKLSGFDELLLEFAKSSDYLYIGYSAGICCLCKDMTAISIMDEPEIDPYDSGHPPIYEGIGFLENAVIPHFQSDHKETEAASRAVEFCEEKGIVYQALHDGDVILKDTLSS